MAEIKPIQIFLCHASEDKASVLEIYDRLKGLGYQPWLDKQNLLPGQNWRREIPKAIRASDYVLIFLSKASVAKRGYVQNEFKLVLEVLRDIREGTIYAIPIRFDDCPIRNQFGDLHWCDIFDVDGFGYLLRALHVEIPPLRGSIAAGIQARPPVSVTPMHPEDGTSLTPQPPVPEMILIPAGAFLMGSDPQSDRDASRNEQPRHNLHLPDFYMARTPITNVQYAAFVKATGHRQPEKWTLPPGKEDHPVVNISWSDALAYCRWLSRMTGKAYGLPSEAEWEKAARGTDDRIYPWGNHWDALCCNSYEGGKGDTTPVGAYPRDATPYGLLDMSGNVWEWTRSLWGETLPGMPLTHVACDIGVKAAGAASAAGLVGFGVAAVSSSFFLPAMIVVGPAVGVYAAYRAYNYSYFGKYPYNAEDERENLRASQKIARVLRGGSTGDNQKLVRCAYRGAHFPNITDTGIGFRVVSIPDASGLSGKPEPPKSRALPVYFEQKGPYRQVCVRLDMPPLRRPGKLGDGTQ